MEIALPSGSIDHDANLEHILKDYGSGSGVKFHGEDNKAEDKDISNFFPSNRTFDPAKQEEKIEPLTVDFAAEERLQNNSPSESLETQINKGKELISFSFIRIFDFHCVKNVCIRNFSGPYFPVFGLNTDIYPVNLHMQSEWGKMRTRKLRIWTIFTQCL